MTGQMDDTTAQGAQSEDRDWPEVEFIMSALDTALGAVERRKSARRPYRVRADLMLFSELLTGDPATLHTRDISEKSLGFITRRRLPLGYGGMLEIPDPTGQIQSIECTLLRCREITPGWFEGALYFNRPQGCFGGEA